MNNIMSLINRVFLVFRRWVEKYVYDFEKEPSNRDNLFDFINGILLYLLP
jgi:hypothetical protein